MIKKLKSNSYYDIVYNISSKRYEKYDRYSRENMKNTNDHSNKHLWLPEERAANRKSANFVGGKCGVKGLMFFDASRYRKSSNLLYCARLNEKSERKLSHREINLRSVGPHPNLIPLPPEYWYKNMQRSKFAIVLQNFR